MAGQQNTEELGMDLLVEQVTSGLSDRQYRRLESILDGDLRETAHDLEAAVAAAAVVFQRQDQQSAPMPKALRTELRRKAADYGQQKPSQVIMLDEHRRNDRSAPGRQPSDSKGPGVWGGMGWAVAAVMALVFVVVQPGGEPPLPGAELLRAEVLASPDVVQWPWRSADGVEGWDGVTGDVVWSDAANSGYMRFVGLPVNDPSQSQYQLWIIDPERDSKPVDGGVFDADSSGAIIVPIQAKLDVNNPRAFAITKEQPGGVVVSEGPLLLVAATGPRPSAS